MAVYYEVEMLGKPNKLWRRQSTASDFFTFLNVGIAGIFVVVVRELIFESLELTFLAE